MANDDRERECPGRAGMDFNIYHKVIKRKRYLTGALLLALLLITACRKSPEYSITFGGDVMLARGGEPLMPGWQQINLQLPKGFQNSHYAVALESPLTDQALSNLTSDLGDMNLCASAEELSILADAQVDVVSFVNNHQDDCNLSGAIETQKLLADAGFTVFDQNQQTWISHVEDSNLSIISIDDVSQTLDEGAINSIIQQEKQAGYFVVLSVHWGNEYQAGPDKKQTLLAKEWVDAGADVIWGHHPHVLQRTEWIESTKDGHQALVLYSLGNLMADQFMLSDTQRTALVKLDFANNHITKVTLLPAAFNWNTKSLDFNLDDATTNQILERLALKPLKSITVDVFSNNN